MKTKTAGVGIGLVALFFLLPGCKLFQKEPQTDQEKFSYYMGHNFGKRSTTLKGAMAVDTAYLKMGLKDGMKGKESAVGMREIQAVMRRMEQEKMKAGEANKEKEKSYLETNKSKEGVKTTKSGLQYKVLASGKGGKKPTKDSRVKVHYKGTLIDGDEFDSSYKRGQPATFGVSQVIPGWTEALTMMSVGDKWQLFIPSELGYKERGAGSIPPNSTLIFEVELLEIL